MGETRKIAAILVADEGVREHREGQVRKLRQRQLPSEAVTEDSRRGPGRRPWGCSLA